MSVCLSVGSLNTRERADAHTCVQCRKNEADRTKRTSEWYTYVLLRASFECELSLARGSA